MYYNIISYMYYIGQSAIEETHCNCSKQLNRALVNSCGLVTTLRS